MKQLIINSVNVKGEITAQDSLIEKILSDSFTFHYIPNGTISRGKGSVKVYTDPNLKKLVQMEYPEAILSGDADNRSYVVLCEYLMERERQDKLGICSISSSSVYKGDEGILFFGGATNLGKSTCALELVDNGYTFFSDEKTLLNLEKGLMVGGSRGIPLRKEIIKKRFVNDPGSFKEIKCDEYKTPQVKLIILPHLDHGLKEPIINPFAPLDLFWHLTKEFSRRIRGDTKFVNYFEYLLPSLDTEELAQKRISITKDFVKGVEGFYFQGNTNQLVKFVKDRI
jgi:hypothetical protein